MTTPKKKNENSSKPAPKTTEVFDTNGNRRGTFASEGRAEAACEALDKARPAMAPHRLTRDKQ